MSDQEQPESKEIHTEKEVEIKVIPSPELQVRLKTSLQKEDKKDVVNMVLTACKIFHATTNRLPDLTITDEYYDTEMFDLYQSGDTCRIREKNAKITLDIKKSIKVSDGKFERQESNLKLSADDRNLLENKGRLPEQVYREINSLPQGYLNKILTVKNLRTSFDITLEKSELEKEKPKFELCLDVFRYKSLLEKGGFETEEFFEIELEAKNDEARDRIDEIKDGITALGSLKLQESEQSKYQVGVDTLKLRSQSRLQAFLRHITKNPVRSFLYAALIAVILSFIGYALSIWQIIGVKK